MAGLRFPRPYFTLAAIPPDAPMSPESPPRAPSDLPQWRWQPWTEADRARPDGAWAAAHGWLASLPGVPAGRLPMHRVAPLLAELYGKRERDDDRR
jgi:hypothetical protein